MISQEKYFTGGYIVLYIVHSSGGRGRGGCGGLMYELFWPIIQ
jgi:hypothetical protein